MCVHVCAFIFRCMQRLHTCEWAFSSEMCTHVHRVRDLAQSILVTNQQWGMGESLRTGEGKGQDGRSIPQYFPHGASFMNDLLIVDLMESGGPAK